MRKHLVVALLIPASLLARVVCALGAGAGAYQANEDQRPSPDAMAVAARMNSALKAICKNQCPQLAVYRNATASNVMLVQEPEQAKLVYAPQFFATAYKTFGDAGLLALMAHEMGHALDDTMGAAWVNAKSAEELRADTWAGCVLGRAQLKEQELGQALAALEKYPAASAQAWVRRVQALRTGYSQCGGSATQFRSKPTAPK